MICEQLWMFPKLSNLSQHSLQLWWWTPRNDTNKLSNKTCKQKIACRVLTALFTHALKIVSPKLAGKSKALKERKKLSMIARPCRKPIACLIRTAQENRKTSLTLERPENTANQKYTKVFSVAFSIASISNQSALNVYHYTIVMCYHSWINMTVYQYMMKWFCCINFNFSWRTCTGHPSAILSVVGSCFHQQVSQYTVKWWHSSTCTAR